MLYNKTIATLFNIFITTFYIYSCDDQVKRYLDIAKRPDDIITAINDAFKNVSSDTQSQWFYNGSQEYNLANIKDEELVEKIITSKPEKKDFYFLDVGAGNFTWGHYIAQYIDTLHTENRIPEDVHVHIINVRGEQNHANLHENGDGRLTWIKTDSYTMYNFGCFKIEELENELHQYDISQKFDLVVSRWTLRHLVDPTGTFVQILNSLNPDGGIFLADGFFLDYTDSKFDEEFNEERNMALLLVNSRIPFLIYPYSCGRSMNQFIVQRPSDGQLQVPLLYHNMRSIGSNYQCNSQRVTEFEKSSEWKDFLNDAIKYKYSLYDNVKNKFKKSYYFGTITSKSLFDWLIEHKLIYPRDSN